MNGTKINYATSDINPTGYAQVLQESYSPTSCGSENTHSYIYGLEGVLELRGHYDGSCNNRTQTMYFVHDGHGSVRGITDQNGAVTDTYDYDAFGVLTHSTGTSPNTTLFAGEQYDPDLGLYFNRARYLSVSTGRFWTADTYEGDIQSPRSLHRYIFAADDSINQLDPSGNDFDLASTIAAATIGTIAANTAITILAVSTAANQGTPPDGIVGSFRVNANGTAYGLTIGGGLDFYYDLHTLRLAVSIAGEFGEAPLSVFKAQRGVTYGGTVGFVWGSPSEFSGLGFTAAWPLSAFSTLAGVFRGTKEPFASMQRLSYLTNRTSIRDWAAVFAFSPSGAAAFEAGPRSNAFSAVVGYSSSYQPVDQLLDKFKSLGHGLSDEIQRLKDLLGSPGGNIEDLDAIIERMN